MARKIHYFNIKLYIINTMYEHTVLNNSLIDIENIYFYGNTVCITVLIFEFLINIVTCVICTYISLWNAH